MMEIQVITNREQLPELAQRINESTSRAEGAARTALSSALEAGEALITAKKLVAHGQWEAWLTENCDVASRTAQSYMRLARSLPMLEDSKAQRVADLPLREAIRAISTNPDAPFRNPEKSESGFFIAKKDDRSRAVAALKKSADHIKKAATQIDSACGLKPAEVAVLRTKLMQAVEALDRMTTDFREVV